MKRSEFTIESWSQRRINEWAHEVSTQKTYARIKSELITADTTTAQKLALITDDSGSIYEVSNSGQTTPPAPERCPSEASFSDKQVGGKAEFSSLGGNPYKERERVYQIEYLQGRKQTESDVDYSSNEEDEWSDPQCEKIAQLEGQLLYGRSKGQDIGLSLQDEFFDWEPLMRIVAIEPSGVRRVFATDDAHWYLGAEKALCNFGCIWVGDLRGEELKLPYQYKLYPTGIGNDGYIGNSAGVGNER